VKAPVSSGSVFQIAEQGNIRSLVSVRTAKVAAKRMAYFLSSVVLGSADSGASHKNKKAGRLCPACKSKIGCGGQI
jgi:hypothetical protein